ncbi:hypothetical protein SDC9_136651 [bioreactor metagenome]|uniref:Uncharacterized protein n=1 Tax=bioreactor metagenome TaxID=1076179 RepID=A0A645DLV5_9ZZZZ
MKNGAVSAEADHKIRAGHSLIDRLKLQPTGHLKAVGGIRREGQAQRGFRTGRTEDFHSAQCGFQALVPVRIGAQHGFHRRSLPQGQVGLLHQRTQSAGSVASRTRHQIAQIFYIALWPANG